MARAKIILDKEYKIAKIDERIYGSFIEHMGRAVYNGIYQPNHPSADENGFRLDVLELVKELNIPIIRYPGGNFVSNFFWEDSVGPKEARKPRMELAWRSLETNEFGLEEFAKWADKAGTDIMMAINLGTRGIADALNLLEYCNCDTDTYYSRLRKSHGIQKPYHIKTWCLGNEMDGPWQLGCKTATEYGRLASETAKAMKLMDESIELVSCGSSSVDMPSFPEWEAVTLDETYNYVDYISLHNYYGNKQNDTEDYFAQTQDMEHFIHTVIAVCDYIKAKKRSKKTLYLSFDEWNVYFHDTENTENMLKKQPWQIAPHLAEDRYDFEDAIMVGLILITFINHADRLKMACLAQLVNVLGPIMTDNVAGAFRQTIYYPFLHASKYGRGTALQGILHTTRHDSSSHEDVTDVETAVVYNEEKEEITIFAVNRNIHDDALFEADLKCFNDYQVLEYLALESTNMKTINTLEEEKIYPIRKTDYVLENGIFQVSMKACSWNVIRFGK